METLTEKDVFTFDELSESAKDTARDSYREGIEFEPCYEPFETAAGILGIEFNYSGRREPDIRWSGFYSQGDGASFVGRYSHSPNSPARIREEFGTETRLHEIADTLNALQNGHRLLTGNRIEAKIEQGVYSGGSYVHEGTMSVTVTDSETGEELEDAEPEKMILEAMRDFARWIYRTLEAEYDYQMSDEAIDEYLKDYDAEYDEDGDEV